MSPINSEIDQSRWGMSKFYSKNPGLYKFYNIIIVFFKIVAIKTVSGNSQDRRYRGQVVLAVLAVDETAPANDAVHELFDPEMRAP